MSIFGSSKKTAAIIKLQACEKLIMNLCGGNETMTADDISALNSGSMKSIYPECQQYINRIKNSVTQHDQIKLPFQLRKV